MKEARLAGMQLTPRFICCGLDFDPTIPYCKYELLALQLVGFLNLF